MSLNVPTGTLKVEFADSKNTYSFIEFAKMSSSARGAHEAARIYYCNRGRGDRVGTRCGRAAAECANYWRSGACRPWMATILEDVSGGFA
jgi:hypothetical protein